MKLSSPYKCDYCDNMKGETNHWWLLLVNPSFELHPWDENFLDAKGVEHICSQACAAKALSSWMSLVSKRSDSDSPCAALELPRAEAPWVKPAVRS